MSAISILEVAKILMQMGKPYVWGGNSPVKGMDCSGFVCEVLRSVGHLEDDYSAQGLFKKYTKTSTDKRPYNQREILPESLLFFGKNYDQITHVAIAIDDKFMFEAGGGDSTTDTIDEANTKNAYIRIRPISRRKDLVGILKIEGE